MLVANYLDNNKSNRDERGQHAKTLSALQDMSKKKMNLTTE